MEKKLYVKTPLIESLVGAGRGKRYLKLENNQPSGSFKLRGVSFHCRQLKASGCSHFVTSSGGNAGLAVAYTGRLLQVPVTVFVPETTPSNVIDKLRKEGADVTVRGGVWDESNEFAEDFVKKNAGASLVHPFHHADIWRGHATMVEELKEELDTAPSAVVLCVGGGGLLCGVVEGLHIVGWSHVPVIAVETVGADCFHKAVQAGHLVTLPAITSAAKCLGALTVSPKALQWSENHVIISEVVEDRDAISACIRFADDHKILVQLACGATLALLYNDRISELVAEGRICNDDNIVFIVCGGSGVKLADFITWKDLG